MFKFLALAGVFTFLTSNSFAVWEEVAAIEDSVNSTLGGGGHYPNGLKMNSNGDFVFAKVHESSQEYSDVLKIYELNQQSKLTVLTEVPNFDGYFDNTDVLVYKNDILTFGAQKTSESDPTKAFVQVSRDNGKTWSFLAVPEVSGSSYISNGMVDVKSGNAYFINRIVDLEGDKTSLILLKLDLTSQSTLTLKEIHNETRKTSSGSTLFAGALELQGKKLAFVASERFEKVSPDDPSLKVLSERATLKLLSENETKLCYESIETFRMYPYGIISSESSECPKVVVGYRLTTADINSSTGILDSNGQKVNYLPIFDAPSQQVTWGTAQNFSDGRYYLTGWISASDGLKMFTATTDFDGKDFKIEEVIDQQKGVGTTVFISDSGEVYTMSKAVKNDVRYSVIRKKVQ